jgi:hypothetical protein
MIVREGNQTVFAQGVRSAENISGVRRVAVSGTKLEIEVVSGEFSFTVTNPS